MIERWAGLARRQPWFAVAVGLCALAVLFAVARTAPDSLPVGSLAPAGEGAEGGSVSVRVTTPPEVGKRVRDVALEVISSQLESDRNVARVEVVRQGDADVLLGVVPADASGGPVAEMVKRLRANLDPGPLRFELGGEMAAIDAARAEIGGKLWRVELPALALAALLLILALGAAGATAALAAAAFALLGALVALRAAGLMAEVSLLGIVAGAPVALALAVELAGGLFARHRSAQALGAGERSARLALAGYARRGALAALAGGVTSLAVLGLALRQGGSLVLGCTLAAALAALGVLLFVPAALGAPDHGRLMQRRPLPAVGARTRVAALAGLGVAGLVLAAPAVAADSHAFAAGGGGGSLAPDLPIAGALALALACAVPAAALRAPRALALAPITVLPAAAGLGACAALADGWLPIDPFGAPLSTLENGALACGMCAVLAVSAARTALACAAAAEAGGVPAAAVRALLRAEVSLPAALGTIVAVLACGALLAVDVYAARQFGAIVATGLLIDGLVARPLRNALAPWLLRGGAGAGASL